MGYVFGGHPFDNREEWLRAICATHITGNGQNAREVIAQLFLSYSEEELAEQVAQKWPADELEGDGAATPYTLDEIARVMFDLRAEFPDWYD
ncbi:MAG: hypothetical protein L0H73_00830 [Nitrococcus sp.]|nr:hypothetical protein [Nitrococcus sp.]